MFKVQDRIALIPVVSIETLTLIERMTLGVGAIFWFTSHTMQCQLEGLGIHIYSWLKQPSICQDASLRASDA
jgi:hypothetical protein